MSIREITDSFGRTGFQDENGNTATIDFWGSKEAALASLETLINCYGCVNCARCKDCVSSGECVDSDGLIECIRCSNSTKSRTSRDCGWIKNSSDLIQCFNCENAKDLTGVVGFVGEAAQ